MDTKQKVLTFPNDKITYCVSCEGTILWHRSGGITILQSGNKQVFECMKHGCALITHSLPDQHSGPDEMGLFLLTLIENGIPTNVVEAAALQLIRVPLAA